MPSVSFCIDAATWEGNCKKIFHQKVELGLLYLPKKEKNILAHCDLEGSISQDFQQEAKKQVAPHKHAIALN